MDRRGVCAPLSMIIAQSMVQGSAIPSEINFARALCVHNALVDVHGETVVNCGVVMMEGGIAEVEMLHF